MPLMPDGWEEGLLPRLTELYKDLHAHPELSFQERRTAGRAAELLAAAGYDVTAGVGGTGVVGVLANGPGPTVMVRADMDALPVREETGLPYASTVRARAEDGEQVPVMHACGHDMHTACLAGAATVLAGARARWSGTLLVVFQPAEERMRGAQAMIEDGLFERFPRPDIVLGQHVGPLPAGWIGYREGTVMAGADTAVIRLFGRGGHGARPESTVDPVVMAAATVLRLQGIVAREVPPQESAVVTVGRLQAGSKENIIPDTAELGVSLRSYNDETRRLLRTAVERVARGESLAGGATRDPEITWDTPAPVLVSDPEATRAVVADLAGHFGADRMLPMPLVTASEDVGRFGTAAGVPTVFWFWGGLETQKVLDALADGTLDQLPGNHSPLFAPLIDPTLGAGVEALTVAALGRFAAAKP